MPAKVKLLGKEAEILTNEWKSENPDLARFLNSNYTPDILDYDLAYYPNSHAELARRIVKELKGEIIEIAAMGGLKAGEEGVY